MTASTQPLSGLKVLDFSTLLPGPLAALMLQEAGAEVIKIERPGGEEMRAYPPHTDGLSALYATLNAGKSIRFIDLKTEAGRHEALELIATADVLIEQFRPGVMARLGLGFDSLQRVNSRLIYCSVTGYGQTGPDAMKAGHDLNYVGDAGLLALGGDAQTAPQVPPGLIADIGGGSFPAVINILLALIQRERTGGGQHLDIAMTDAMFTFAWWAFGTGIATGTFPEGGEGKLAGGSPQYRVYRAADGGLIAVAALEDKFWARFCAAIDLSERESDAGTVAARLQTRTAADWKPVLEAADCCVTVVRSLQDAIQHPHFVQRGLFDPAPARTSDNGKPVLPLPIAKPFRG